MRVYAVRRRALKQSGRPHCRNAERRTQPFALMSRLSLFGVPRAQTLAVFTLTEAIPGLVGWRELFANRPVGGVRTGHNLLASVLEQLGREQFS
jgi:hypothetical protein